MSAPQATKMRHELGWRVEAWTEYLRHLGDLEQLRTRPLSPSSEVTDALQAELEHVAESLNEKWWSNPDLVWSQLHRVEVGIARAAKGDLLLGYAVRARAHLTQVDADKHDGFLHGDAFTEVEKVAKAGRIADGSDEAVVAAQVACVLDHVHAIVDEKHGDANQRKQRLLTVAGLAAALSLLVTAAAIWMTDLPFLVGAENFADVSRVQVALLVALGGLVGGSWGAFPTLVGAARDRYRLQFSRALARLMMGVLAALIGVSLVGASWVTELTASSAPALFAISLAFGLSQEPITRVLEGKLPTSKAATSSGEEPAG